MEIIIKKNRESKRFYPHMNRELGKYYHSSRDYVSDMKRAGVEPYRPGEIKRPEAKKYERSDWAKSMYADISRRAKDGRKPGEKFINELKKRGFTQESYEKARKIANER